MTLPLVDHVDRVRASSVPPRVSRFMFPTRGTPFWCILTEQVKLHNIESINMIMLLLLVFLGLLLLIYDTVNAQSIFPTTVA